VKHARFEPGCRFNVLHRGGSCANRSPYAIAHSLKIPDTFSAKIQESNRPLAAEVLVLYRTTPVVTRNESSLATVENIVVCWTYQVPVFNRPHVRLSAGRPVSQYAGNEGCAGLAGTEPHA
jgi:hypothetical protein